jgi:hypothetical protein
MPKTSILPKNEYFSPRCDTSSLVGVNNTRFFEKMGKI